MRRTDVRPDARHGLFALRTITTHGPVPSPDVAEWVYGNIKADVHLVANVGGVDSGGALAGGDPTAAVWPGEAQRPALGVEVDVVDTEGVSMPPGHPGAIVSRSSFPSLPLGLWDDDDGSRFRADHFARFDGLWVGAGRASWGTNGGIVGHSGPGDAFEV
jgi:acetoacetyl-CoA synthetase